MFCKLTSRHKDTIECVEEPPTIANKRRSNDVNCKESQDMIQIDRFSDEDHDFFRANIVGKSAKITSKLDKMFRFYPIPGKFSVKLIVIPKLTIFS